MENSQNNCPSLQEIELLALDDSKLTAEILAHFESCRNCKSQYEELVQYYKLLQKELAEPVSNTVVSFIQELESESVVLSVIRLNPLQNKSEVNPTFRSELIFQNLQDTTFLEFPEIDSDEILLRLLQDHEDLQGCIVVLAKEPAYYRNVKLLFKELDLAIKVNSSGFAKVDPIKPESLADQIVELVP